MQKGLTESLAGRFEVLHLPHWSFPEMRDAFGFSLEQYLYFGGYPGRRRSLPIRRAGGVTCSTRSSRPPSRATCCC
jgi:hypothetical protein